MSDLKKQILKIVEAEGEVVARDLVKKTGKSKSYVLKFLKELVEEGEVFLIGSTNNAKYVVDLSRFEFVETFRNRNLSEEDVFTIVRGKNFLKENLKSNIYTIFEYAFLEMMNNAIEHSKSEKIEVTTRVLPHKVRFLIKDFGVGVFQNIKDKLGLSSELDGVNTVLKGKQTTYPEHHTGQGIFFTSKAGDLFVLESGRKKLVIDNVMDDEFIEDISKLKGTRVVFEISVNGDKNLTDVFRKFSGEDFGFDKTEIRVELYKEAESHISRSQARKVMTGLDKFKIIVLDFKNIGVVGQAFTDEVFRVWQNKHVGVRIEYENCNENVEFMIKRSL